MKGRTWRYWFVDGFSWITKGPDVERVDLFLFDLTLTCDFVEQPWKNAGHPADLDTC